MNTLHTRQHGFTIVELMIATTVFSTVLLLCAVGLVSVGRMYQKGSTARVTQESARSIMDQLQNDFELSGGYYQPLARNGSVDGFCIGDNMYSYQEHVVGALKVSKPAGGCAGAQPDLSLGRELLGRNMQLGQLDVSPAHTGTPVRAVTIRLKVVYGDSDLLVNRNTPEVNCRGGFGQEYCAVAALETYATRRL
jgi:prepilin-type N-terminal cleavage/methylation domain-containing protein